MKNIILMFSMFISLGIFVSAGTFADIQRDVMASIKESPEEAVQRIVKTYTGSDITTNANVMKALKAIIQSKNGTFNDFTRVYNYAVDTDLIQTKNQDGYERIGKDRANLLSASAAARDDVFNYIADEYFMRGGSPNRFMIDVFQYADVPPMLSKMFSKLPKKWQDKYTPIEKTNVIMSFAYDYCEYGSYLKDFLTVVKPEEITNYFDASYLYMFYRGGDGIYGMNEKCIGKTNVTEILIRTLKNPDKLRADYGKKKIPLLALWALQDSQYDEFLDLTKILLDNGSNVYSKVEVDGKSKTILQIVEERGTDAAIELVKQYK